jgi:aspartate-semialdehyde dehydrogenase
VASILTFAVLDPTSTVGRDVIERLAGAFPAARRRLFHTSASEEHLISEVAGAAELVPPLVEADELEGAAVVINTVPPSPAVARSLLAWLRGHPEVVLIDLGQPALAGPESAVVSGWTPRPLGSGRWYHLPDPLIAGPLRVLEALASLEPRACHLTVFGSVAGFGAGALEELAGQGADRLSGRTPRRAAVLPRVLAFDLAPAEPARRERLAAELAVLFPAVDFRLHAVDAGLFHGHAAAVDVACGRPVTRERARKLLRAAAGLRLARERESLLLTDVVEDNAMVCGGVEASGGWLSLWLAGDGQRLAGAAAVMELLSTVMAS